MTQETFEVTTADIVSEEELISFVELCRCCGHSAERMLLLVEHGIISPVNLSSPSSRWQFSRVGLLRAQSAVRLQRDLGVNLAGAALALELLDEVKTLRQMLAARN